MISNPARLRGYSPREIAALRNAATTGAMTNALRVPRSRLLPYVGAGIGGAMGGIPGVSLGGTSAHVGSEVSRNAATRIQARKLQRAIWGRWRERSLITSHARRA